jgi:hypothetical protein
VTPPPAPTPTIANLRLSPTTFRAARAGGPVQAAATRGTRVSYTLNVAATVSFTVERATTGRQTSGRCVKQTRANRGRASCTLYTRLSGTIVRTRPAGPDQLTFTGRLRNRALKPGRYRLVAQPSAGTRTGAEVRARFRIAKP